MLGKIQFIPSILKLLQKQLILPLIQSDTKLDHTFMSSLQEISLQSSIKWELLDAIKKIFQLNAYMKAKEELLLLLELICIIKKTTDIISLLLESKGH